jgi:hypothetical protein
MDGLMDLVRFMLDYWATVDGHSVSKQAESMLSWACIDSQELIVKDLPSAGGNIDSKDECSSMPPLRSALTAGKDEIACLLLKSGAKTEPINLMGTEIVVLLYAAVSNCSQVV